MGYRALNGYALLKLVDNGNSTIIFVNESKKLVVVSCENEELLNKQVIIFGNNIAKVDEDHLLVKLSDIACVKE